MLYRFSLLHSAGSKNSESQHQIVGNIQDPAPTTRGVSPILSISKFRGKLFVVLKDFEIVQDIKEGVNHEDKRHVLCIKGNWRYHGAWRIVAIEPGRVVWRIPRRSDRLFGSSRADTDSASIQGD